MERIGIDQHVASVAQCHKQEPYTERRFASYVSLTTLCPPWPNHHEHVVWILYLSMLRSEENSLATNYLKGHNNVPAPFPDWLISSNMNTLAPWGMYSCNFFCTGHTLLFESTWQSTNQSSTMTYHAPTGGARTYKHHSEGSWLYKTSGMNVAVLHSTLQWKSICACQVCGSQKWVLRLQIRMRLNSLLLPVAITEPERKPSNFGCGLSSALSLLRKAMLFNFQLSVIDFRSKVAVTKYLCSVWEKHLEWQEAAFVRSEDSQAPSLLFGPNFVEFDWSSVVVPCKSKQSILLKTPLKVEAFNRTSKDGQDLRTLTVVFAAEVSRIPSFEFPNVSPPMACNRAGLTLDRSWLMKILTPPELLAKQFP